MFYQIAAAAIMLIFYSIYIGKMISQKKKGIQTDQIAKGKKDRKLMLVEFPMKIAAFCIIAVEVVSIAWMPDSTETIIKIIGFCLGVLGDGIFGIAVWTMRDSWRAGIPENDKTDIVTTGIYQYSRNPAFLGFYMVYIGVLLIAFNWVLLFFTVWAIIMLHLQILQEEKFLASVFGQRYMEYKSKTCRYLGQK